MELPEMKIAMSKMNRTLDNINRSLAISKGWLI